MQMRSAEEAQSSAREQQAQPSDVSVDERAQPLGDEFAALSADADELAEQETATIAPPDDPFAASGVTIQPNRPPRAQATPVVEYVAPQLLAQVVDSVANTTLTFSPNTAAGLSYLFLWISGVLIFFNERRNRYVRFHALQSILFGAAVTVAGVAASIITALLVDLSRATHWGVFAVIGYGIAVLTAFSAVVIWSWLAVAAWTGNGSALPILGRYAKHYSEGTSQPFGAPRA